MYSEERIKLHPLVDIQFVTPINQSFFFGYYNYSPISYDGSKLLAHKAYFEGRMPTPTDHVDIGYYDLLSMKWHQVSRSNAFNWQQGSMLQWLGPDFNSKIIFNDILENKFVSRLINIQNGKEKIIPYPIYGIDPNGMFSISLNFERCYWTRAYSYAGIANEFWNVKTHADDGIYKIDLETGVATKILGIMDVLDHESLKDEISNKHWLEHIMLNPGGSRFAFYHRYGSDEEYCTRVFTADNEGKEIWAHPHKKGNNYSHLGWVKDDTYVLYTMPEKTTLSAWKNVERKKSGIGQIPIIYRKLLKPFVPRGIAKAALNSKGYYALVQDQGKIVQRLDTKMLSSDGHPSFSKDGRFMITDTYEDLDNYRRLLLYDTLRVEILELGKFYSTFNSCGWRADLHPRFSPDEEHIIIDTTHNGHHQMLILKLHKKLLEKL